MIGRWASVRGGAAIGALLWVWFASLPVHGANLAPLIESARNDPSYKVRIQALRILRKRVQVEGGQTPEEVRVLLRQQMRQDPNHLVRALALRTLAELGGPAERGQVALGTEDAHPFVRAQAQEALGELDARDQVRPPLVLEAQATPEQGGAEMEGFIRGRLRLELERTEPTAFDLSGASDRPGYLVRVTIGDLGPDPAAPEKLRVELKVLVATWPAKNIRHVITARARATGSRSDRLVRKLVEAAVQQAARDVIQEIRRG